ncbi:MAG: amino acid racemase [Proteobacteria bacterium]|nr:amino acid racemase [Pseudomonadota bacterium]
MQNVKPHVGIVGCSAEGAALCYRTFCIEGADIFGRHDHPDVSMHTHSLADYMIYVKAGDWAKVGELILSSAQKLQKIGAQVLICPDNTIHEALDTFRAESPLPWLHIAEVVVANAKERGVARLGILGTKHLMEGPVYRDACARTVIQCAIPSETDRKAINGIIFDELVNGVFTEQSRKFFHDRIDDLKRSGCDGVVLGCTEIPLIVDSSKASLPTFDSTRLLARAALKWSQERQNG